MKRIKKGNALILTTVILFAVSTIAVGITMYFYHAALLANNTNIYSQKRVDLENEFNKNYMFALKNYETEDTRNIYSFFHYSSQETMAFLDGEYYSTIRHEEEAGNHIFTYEIETTYKRRECHLVKTISRVGDILTVNSKEVYHVSINN